MHRRITPPLGGNHLEVSIALGAEYFGLDIGDDGLLGRLAHETIEKRAHVVVVALDFKGHAMRAVADEATETELRGVAIHRRTEADTLDAASDLCSHAGSHPCTIPS